MEAQAVGTAPRVPRVQELRTEWVQIGTRLFYSNTVHHTVKMKTYDRVESTRVFQNDPMTCRDGFHVLLRGYAKKNDGTENSLSCVVRFTHPSL